MGWPQPRRMPSSMSSRVANPDSYSRIACVRKGMSSRLTMKPPRSWATMIRLPSRSPRARVSSSVSSLVAMLRTTSISFITGAGLKKCVPMTRSGRRVARAISMIGSAEVLVARIASSETMAVELLEERDLGRELLDDRLDAEIALAEILEAGREREQTGDPVEVLLAELAGLAAALERRVDAALSGGQLLGSRLGDQGSDPVARATSAIPEPISPAPMIPTLPISIDAPPVQRRSPRVTVRGRSLPEGGRPTHL